MRKTPAEIEAYLVANGISPEEAKEAVADLLKQDAAITAGRCPKCDGPLTRKRDPRQAGETFGHGTWFNYRCARCGHFVDRAEEAN